MTGGDHPGNAGFIGRVVADPSHPPQTRLLAGWLGEAADADHRRLYTGVELTDYLDIPAEAILHTEPIQDVQPEGGVFVWVRQDAAVQTSADARAKRFLQGQVARDFTTPGSTNVGPPRR